MSAAVVISFEEIQSSVGNAAARGPEFGQLPINAAAATSFSLIAYFVASVGHHGRGGMCLDGPYTGIIHIINVHAAIYLPAIVYIVENAVNFGQRSYPTGDSVSSCMQQD